MMRVASKDVNKPWDKKYINLHSDDIDRKKIKNKLWKFNKYQKASSFDETVEDSKIVQYKQGKTSYKCTKSNEKSERIGCIYLITDFFLH